MSGKKETITYLNKILKNELTAINQYFLHARMLEDWGYPNLAKTIRDDSIAEMKHADKLISRILFLHGLPNLQVLGKLSIGENVKEILTADSKLEEEAIPLLKEAIAHTEKVSDFITRELLSHILAEEEEHLEWLETQLSLMEKLGEAMYLQKQI